MDLAGASLSNYLEDAIQPMLLVPLPPFWPQEPAIWFAKIEGQFEEFNLTSDSTKFYYVLSQLGPEYTAQVKDIIANPPALNKYGVLKTAVISRLSGSGENEGEDPSEVEVIEDQNIETISIESDVSLDNVISVLKDLHPTEPEVHGDQNVEISKESEKTILEPEQQMLGTVEPVQDSDVNPLMPQFPGSVLVSEMEMFNLCVCCLLWPPDKNLSVPYSCHGRTEIYSNLLESCFQIQLALGSKKFGICEECVGRLRDARVFKVQVECCLTRMQAWLQIDLEFDNVEPCNRIVLGRTRDAEWSFEVPQYSGNVMEMVKLCVCCVLRPQDKNLSVPYSCHGRTEIYSDMLEYCFQIQLARGNKKLGICEECVGRLRDANDFKEQVECCLTRLQACLQTEPEFDDDEHLVKTDVYSDNEVADDDTQSEPVMKIEIEEDGVSGATSRQQQPTHDEALPVKTETNEKSDSEITPSRLAASGRARQQLAMTCCVRLERLRPRRGAARGREARLALRRETTRGREARLASHETDSLQDATEACGSQVARSTALSHQLIKKEQSESEHSSHISKPTRQQFYNCEIFVKQFKYKSLHDEHKRVHTGDRPYTCDICKKSLTRKDHLADHMKRHMGKLCYPCTDCSRKFATRSQLKDHKALHSGVRPFSCEQCNKRFARKGHHNQHKLIHSKEKTFSCEECAKKFIRKDKLMMHKLIHTGERPYACEICKKLFYYNRSLVRHLKIHSREKIECDMCNCKFSHKSSLKKHIRLLHAYA